jgi:hypothetical protein
MQIMSGLRYLYRPFSYGSSSGQPGDAEDPEKGPRLPSNYGKKLSIIHYDLKPANILFDEMGDVKITGKSVDVLESQL